MLPVFEDRIISRRADIIWPPRSCDLTPLDYYLWDTVKNRCYAAEPDRIDALKDNIREAIGEIQLHTIDNVLKNWTDRVGHFMASRRSHLNEIIFHYLAEGLYFQIKKKIEKILSSFLKSIFQKKDIGGSNISVSGYARIENTTQ